MRARLSAFRESVRAWEWRWGGVYAATRASRVGLGRGWIRSVQRILVGCTSEGNFSRFSAYQSASSGRMKRWHCGVWMFVVSARCWLKQARTRACVL